MGLYLKTFTDSKEISIPLVESKDNKMEKELENIKEILTDFIKKYQLKALKINTDISYHSRLNTENPSRWINENYSTVNKIDINLTK